MWVDAVGNQLRWGATGVDWGRLGSGIWMVHAKARSREAVLKIGSSKVLKLGWRLYRSTPPAATAQARGTEIERWGKRPACRSDGARERWRA